MRSAPYLCPAIKAKHEDTRKNVEDTRKDVEDTHDRSLAISGQPSQCILSENLKGTRSICYYFYALLYAKARELSLSARYGCDR